MKIFSFLLSTSLRFFTLIAKFLFSIFLAKELSSEGFADWILITSLINYLVLFYGMEFYNLTLRDFFQNKDLHSVSKILFQWNIHIKTYLLSFFICFLYCIFVKFQVLIVYFLLVLILEHITTEFYRISCFYGDVFFSNLILFLKSSFWMLIFFFFNHEIKIELVILFWIFGLLATFLLCIFKHFRLIKKIWIENKLKLLKEKHFNKRLFFAKLKPFLILALCLRAPFVIDKLFISSLDSPQDLAIYGYYFNFANGVQSLFEAFFVISILPTIMKLRKTTDIRHMYRNFLYKALIFWIFCSILILFLLPEFDNYIMKSYSSDPILFLVIMASQFIFSLSVLYQYVLYSFKLDNYISQGAIIFSIVSFALFYLLIPLYGAYGASIAILLSCLILLIVRSLQVSKIL